MPLIDSEGRVAGRLNLVDLGLVLGLCILVATAYLRLSAPYRVAPSFASESAAKWVQIELQLSEETPWMEDHAIAGVYKQDPPEREKILEVLSNAPSPEGLRVRLRVQAVEDASGRLIFENRTLLPGQRFRILTNSCVLEGVLRKISRDDD